MVKLDPPFLQVGNVDSTLFFSWTEGESSMLVTGFDIEDQDVDLGTTVLDIRTFKEAVKNWLQQNSVD